MRRFAPDGVNRVPAGDAPRRPFDIGVWEADLMTGEVRVTDRFAAMLGEPPGVTHRHRDELRARVHPDDRERVRAAFESALAGAGEYGVEYRSLGDDGQVRRLASSVVIVRDVSGRPLRAIGTAVDITRRERPEEAQARLAAIVEGSDDAIIGKSLDGIVTSWNQGAERIFGYTAEEMVGSPLSRLVPPDRPDEVPSILAAIRRGERVEHFDTERVRKDGQRIQVSLSISPIRDATGDVIGASKIARDVTDRKRAEEERERLLAEAKQARAEVEMKVSEIFRKYGDKLSAEQKADVRKVMAEGQEGLEKMRAFVVQNSDQPATVFKTYRNEGKK